jgi:hypothetical protein
VPLEQSLELPLTKADRGGEGTVDPREVETRDLPPTREDMGSAGRLGDAGVVAQLKAAPWRSVARETAARWGAASTIRWSIPCRSSSHAKVNPTGPAPATSTETSTR